MKLLKHASKGKNPLEFKVQADLSCLLLVTIYDIMEMNLTEIIKLRGEVLTAILLPNELLKDQYLEEDFYNSELWGMIKVQLTENTSLIYY